MSTFSVIVFGRAGAISTEYSAASSIDSVYYDCTVSSEACPSPDEGGNRMFHRSERLPHRYTAAVLAVVLTVFLAAGITSCGESGAPQFSRELQEKLSAAVDGVMEEFQVPGAIVGVWVPGEGQWVVTRGEANTETKAAPETGDHIRMASITKGFTATAILQLVDQGKLALEDRLKEFDLGVTVPNSDTITVRNLLNMTSGLFSYTDDEAFGEEIMSDPTRSWTNEQLVEISSSHGPVSEPGQEFQYCNTNYILLGMIIEEVTGETTGDVIKTNIIDRLDLKNTSYPDTNAMPSPFMRGYMADPGSGDLGGPAVVDVSDVSPTMGGAAGAMISNLADMKTWVEALGSGTLLSDEMHREQLKFEPPNTEAYGLGVMNGRIVIGHSGEIPGYNNSMYTQPGEGGATIIVLFNRYPSEVEGASDQALIGIVEALEPLLEDGER